MSSPTERPGPRRWIPLLTLLLLLGGFHGSLASSWLHRSPAPIASPHANDHAALVHALTLAGRADLNALEGGMFGQEDCSTPRPGGSRWAQLRGALRSDPGTTYRNKTPLAYLLGAVSPLLLGFGPTTVRAGSLVLLALLAAATLAATRSMASRGTAMAAACAVTLLPVSIGGTQTLFPTLGCMAGAAIGLALLLASDRFRRPWVALLAGVAAVACMRWGESFNDGLRTVSVLAGPALLLAFAGLADRERRWRAALGILAFALVALLLFDWGLARASVSDLLSQATGGGGDGLAPLENLGSGLATYLWVMRHRLLGLCGCIVVAAGLVPLLARSRPRVESIALVLAIVGPLLLLSLAEKRASYYLAVIAAPTAMAATIGLAALPRIGSWMPWAVVVILLPGATALYVTESPDPANPPPARSWHAWAALDTLGGNDGLPDRLNLTHNLPVSFPPVEPLRPERPATADWLQSPEVDAILNALPRGAVVAVQGWVHPHCDVAAFTIQARHPRLEVVTVKVPQQPLGCAEPPALWVSVRWGHEPSSRPHWASRWERLAGGEYVELYARGP